MGSEGDGHNNNLVVDDSSELSSENEGMRNNSVTSGVPPPHLALSYYFSTEVQ